eukprot:1039995-Rhodomonas_salina.2
MPARGDRNSFGFKFRTFDGGAEERLTSYVWRSSPNPSVKSLSAGGTASDKKSVTRLTVT